LQRHRNTGLVNFSLSFRLPHASANVLLNLPKSFIGPLVIGLFVR
jgi:hypothetical protein